MQISVLVRLILIHMAKLKFLVCAEAADNSLQWKFIKKCGMKNSMVFNIPGQFVQSETERLNSLNLSFGKLKLLYSNFTLPRMEIKMPKTYLCLPHDSFASGALLP